MQSPQLTNTMNKAPHTRAELEQSFDNTIAPLYDIGVGFRIGGILFEDYHFVNNRFTPDTQQTVNKVSIFIGMMGTIQNEVKSAFRSYLKPLLVGRESMSCLMNVNRPHIKLWLAFDDRLAKSIFENGYLNDDVILALQIMRERGSNLVSK